MTHLRPRHVFAFAAAVCLVSLGSAAQGPFPPPNLEISAERPLFLFTVFSPDTGDAVSYAQQVVQAWPALPEELRAYSAVRIEAHGADAASRHQWLRDALAVLQEANLPVFAGIGDGDGGRLHPLERAEELLREFTCVRGLAASALPFEEYCAFTAGDVAGPPLVVHWLLEATDLAARYGRFLLIELDQIRWPRVMSNASCRPLYDKFRTCAPYVIPVASCRGPHTVPQTSALLGLWLEGAVDQWGVAPDSRWYTDARFIAPGVFGVAENPAAMPPPLYRAMILNGAMLGASVYSFPVSADLWPGPARKYWDEAIYPALEELLKSGLIPRKDFVRKKTAVAYQLAAAQTAEDFHLNLRDIDGVLDKGFLMHGAYGMERPGQAPELIPNTGRYYWVPFLSAWAPLAVVGGFGAVVQPGIQTSAEAWTELLSRYHAPDGEGTAFITRVGRGAFILNTAENQQQAQTFRLAAVPAPVRQLTARRQDGGVLLAWPFRAGDLSYHVYKRVAPETRFTLIADGIAERQFLDATAGPNDTLAYAVTALTDETETYEGVVNYGDYLVLSNVESRIAEEAVLTPLLTTAESRPVESPPAPAEAAPWWPTYPGVSEGQMPIAEAIVKRLEAWDRAFAAENLSGVLDLYAAEYEDPQGWKLQYARRAYQWFFEHYNACAMHRQIRQWDFSAYETAGTVSVLLYCRFTGYALTGPMGLHADLPAYFPRTANSEVWVTFREQDSVWRITRTNPALPNFKDILSFSASPYDNMPPGPDL